MGKLLDAIGDSISRDEATELNEELEGILFSELPAGSFTKIASDTNLRRVKEIVKEYEHNIKEDEIDDIDMLIKMKKVKIKIRKCYVATNPAMLNLIADTHFKVYNKKLILLGHIPIVFLEDYREQLFTFLTDDTVPFGFNRLSSLLEKDDKNVLLGTLSGMVADIRSFYSIDNVISGIENSIAGTGEYDVEYAKALTSPVFDALLDFLTVYLGRQIKEEPLNEFQLSQSTTNNLI